MKKTNELLIPGAIVLAGVFIAGAVFFSNGGSVDRVGTEAHQADEQMQPVATTDKVRPVTTVDHIKGNPDAPIKIVEYSDFECPFCQQFHRTLTQVMDKYGADGEVAWVFRQFPIEQLHSKAPAVAMASECVAELGGNDAFWQFTDSYFEVTLTNNRTDIEKVIPQLVQEIGINQSDFQTCFESGRHNEKIAADFNNAAESGGQGTPWSVVIAPNGKTFPLSGSQPLGSVEKLIEIARSEI